VAGLECLNQSNNRIWNLLHSQLRVS